MNSTSTLYNSIFSGIHRFEVKVNIGSTDYSMNVLTSLNSCRSVFGSGSPRLGLAPAGELSLSLYLNSASVPRMAEIRPYFRVVNDTQQSEWIAKGVYYVDTRFRYAKEIDAEIGAAASTNPVSDNPPAAEASQEKADPLYYPYRMIDKSMAGTDVAVLQAILTARGYYTGSLDSLFGDALDAAVRKFQSDHTLDPDGVVGPLTWRELLKLSP